VRAITKAAEPASLTAHRLRRPCDYHNYAAKDELRRSLVTEQRGLCCYCLGRIQNEPTAMKIEHWRCQARYPNEQLNYRNILGACLGGHGQPRRLQHCDARKGDSDLRWNPADPGHRIEVRVRYELNGCILSDDPLFDSQLNEVLNLNLPRLRNNRKGVLDAVLAWWKHERARIGGPVPQSRFVRERDRRIAGIGELQPHCDAAVWWLGKRVARMAG
jgi:uncharacterized protein (TIGR02646 family)